jgi:hypothetical protein
VTHHLICAASGGFDLQGGLIIALFLVMIALMYTRRLSALLALPILGVGVALIGAIPWAEAWRTLFAEGGGIGAAWATLSLKPLIVDRVIKDGAVMLKTAYTIAMIGGMLAILIKEKRIAETLIKYAAELSGDNPIKVALLMMLVVAMLFTSMGGLGAIIMTGTIVFPIMMSLGVAPLTAAGIFLIGFCAGGTLNPGNWALYESALGLEAKDVQLFAFITMFLYFATGLVFMLVNLRGGASFWATARTTAKRTGVRPIALLAPIVPIVLAFKFSTLTGIIEYYAGWELTPDQIALGESRWFLAAWAEYWDANIGGWDYVGAFFAGILFTFITTLERGKPNIQIMTKAIIVGAESVIPAVLLMIGLGIVLQGMWQEEVRLHLRPYIDLMVPSGPFGYVVIFTLLAPLALYRGPLNVWGLGLGVAALIYGAGRIGALPVMAVFMSVGAIQGVCDPTNTHNIWIASYIGEDVMRITRKTLGYVWCMAAVGLVVASVIFAGEFTRPLAESSLELAPDSGEVAPGDSVTVTVVIANAEEENTVRLSTSLPRALEGISVSESAGGAVNVGADELIVANISVPPGETVVVIEGVVRVDLLDGAEIAPTVTLRPDHGALATLETPLALAVSTEGVE